MKVLILGKGYVGTYLTKYIPNSVAISKQEVDYHNIEELESFINLKGGFNYIVNCSGFTGRPNVDQAEDKKQECWDLNVSVPVRISNFCKNSKIAYIHISSGCIYTGYEKEWTEEDIPNYGLFNQESSFYSKSKHGYETCSNYGLTIRIRMPFDDDVNSPRSVLCKLRNYDNVVDFKNSKTYIPDICEFIKQYIDSGKNYTDVVNLVSPNALTTKQVTYLMSEYGKGNQNWEYVDFASLNTKAGRSNCVLSIDKIIKKYNFRPTDEKQALIKVLKNEK